MSEPGTARKATPREFLDIRERQWRPLADVVSLAAETLDQIPSHRREQALTVIGRILQLVGPGIRRDKLLRRWPSVQVFATAGVAAEHYERATFWPKLIAILNI